jgi:hypothetical protein
VAANAVWATTSNNAQVNVATYVILRIEGLPG